VDFSVVDISGNWQLEPIATAMAVGPNESALNWWSNNLSDVKTRSCLFDDVYQINSDGTFRNILGAETWLENWQNAGAEGCYSPKSPYNGMDTGKWEIDSISNELIIHGNGHYLGLPKVTNQGEIGNGATEPIYRKYRISLSGNRLTTGINFGSGYWQFKFIKTNSTATAANIKAGKPIFIFPNPASNQIQLEYAGKICAIRITDIYGKTLIQTHNRTINISTLKAAPYIIQIETENGIIVSRFIKASE